MATLGALVISATVAAGGSSEPPPPARQLHDLFAEHWHWQMRDSPVWASELGERRWDDRWPERSLESFAERDRHDREALARLGAIPRDALGPAEQVNYDLFRRRLEEDLEERRYRTYLIPLNQRGGIQTEHEVAERLRFSKLDDFSNWIERLRRLGDYVDETIALMREGMRVGIVPPRIIMERVPEQIAHQLVSDPRSSPFFGPLLELPEELPAAERERLQTTAEVAIRDVVVPAYRRFHAFFTEHYLPAARASIGASALPSGEEFYRHRARRYTTTELTPQEIHDTGLAEVARIRAEMEAIVERVGFEGDFASFLRYLRTDPKFYFEDPGELLDAYRAASKRVDPELVSLFGQLPRMPYGVRPIPMESAPDTTTAYYTPPAADGSRAGIYWVNLYKPEVRPRYEIMALTLHEAVPGHHLQVALAQELGELPEFRRYTGYTAFVEGWALYAESLGEEMELYDDPYSKFGQLTYEMWRAVRLVVDTGIHAFGWDRDRAIDFFAANAAKTRHDIVNEVDRYIAWPGQALAYKVGELRIQELRRRAEHALGERFDIRAFHDVVLSSGAVPLDVLEANIDAWLVRAGVDVRGRPGADGPASGDSRDANDSAPQKESGP